MSLKSGSKIKYTVQKWLTPKGEWVEGEGIKPTHKVSNDDNYYQNPIDENDLQLKKAIELVTK
jgi:carboxyl-terminal processing protease